MMPVECDVVTLSEQRHSERSQGVTVMDDGWTMRGQDSRQEMRSGGRAARQTHSGRSVALKPRVIDGYDAASEVPETQTKRSITLRLVIGQAGSVRNVSMTAKVASGASRVGMWPPPGMTSKRAWGKAAA
jgi:hypothetical protein